MYGWLLWTLDSSFGVFLFCLRVFWRGRSLFNLAATWALPKDVAFQTAVRAFSATALMLDKNLALEGARFLSLLTPQTLTQKVPAILEL